MKDIAVHVVIQARMGSSRFPGKSLAEISGKPILWYLFRQLSYCRAIDRVILATTDQPGDDILAEYAGNQGWESFRGSESDVLARYHGAMTAVGAMPDTGLVRLTGDDILTDPHLVDAVADAYRSHAGFVSLVTTDRNDRLPYGAQVELCSFTALDRAFRETNDPVDREHVFPYIRNNPGIFPAMELVSPVALPPASLSIDRPADLERNALLIGEMLRHTEPPFSLCDVLNAARSLAARGISVGVE